MAKITYADKIPKRERLSSYNNDEFTLADANEVKNVVNELSDNIITAQAPASLSSNITSFKRVSDTVYDVVDQYTGEQFTMNKVTGISDDSVDNVIYFKIGTEYFKRNSNLTNVRWFGAKGNNVADDIVPIQAAILTGSFWLQKGAYKIGSSILYRKDAMITGEGKSFSGTIIKPSGDFPALQPKIEVPAISFTKNTFKDFQIDASNITTTYALVVQNSFLTEYVNIWIRNSTKGVLIENSDAVSFYNLMVMEDSHGYAVTLGNGARSIKFYSCCFEKNPGNINPGGTILISGQGTNIVTSADFFGCQLERSGILVDAGTIRWIGGKIGASSTIVLGAKSRDCVISSDTYDDSTIQDFGYNNKIENAYSNTMATPLHQYPLLPSTSAAATYGVANDEYLFLVTAAPRINSAVTNAKIEIKEGATILATSPLFNLPSTGTTIGSVKRHTYSFVSLVKNVAAASGPVVTGASLVGVRGGKNLLTNGTFAGGASTGWGFNSSSGSISGDDLLVTPSGTSWGLYHALSAVCKIGKRYIAVAKYVGNADFILGESWNGTAGARQLLSFGVDNLYGDGDKVAMLSFEYNGQSNFLSLGKQGSNTAVTVKWIGLIEC